MGAGHRRNETGVAPHELVPRHRVAVPRVMNEIRDRDGGAPAVLAKM
jgi:hypothetical protein